MPSEHKESLDRLREEIVPLFKSALLQKAAVFSNPRRLRCREALACQSPECALYDTVSDHLPCWQAHPFCCRADSEDGLARRLVQCTSCSVFRESCPTVVEEIGEYLGMLSLLIREQGLRIMEDTEHMATIRQELNAVVEQLTVKEKEIQEIMITDKLTTLFNREHLITVLEDEIARCQRYGRPLSLIMIDIDEFKSFNERYGQQAGDGVLSFVGALIKQNTRKFDRAFRYGGEEFVVVLPESDLTMAYIVAERIRRGFESKSFPVRDRSSGAHQNISRTISMGITATYAFGTEDISIEDLIIRTDSALRRAKDRGGNICIRYEQTP